MGANRVAGYLLLATASVVHFEWNIQPRHAHINIFTSQRVTCLSDFALQECHFRIWEGKYAGKYPESGPVMDFSRGADSPAVSHHWDDDRELDLHNVIYTAQYAGTGLDDGQCGMDVKFQETGWYVVGCRGATVKGVWNYAYMTLYVTVNQRPFVLDTSPAEVIARTGSDVNVSCTAALPMTDCTFELPKRHTALLFVGNDTSTPDGEFYNYVGRGLWKGECGVTLNNITEEDNGLVKCLANVQTADEELRIIPVVVAKPPDLPELLISTVNLTDGDTLTAWCYARNSRPVAKLQWYLGDELVRDDIEDDTPLVQWRWLWDAQSIMQNLSLTITTDDDGKMLKCVVTHDETNYTQYVAYTVHVARGDKRWFITGTCLIVFVVICFTVTMVINIVARITITWSWTKIQSH